MALTSEKIKAFKRIGHNLKPVVTISENGLSESVQKELERALNDHELIKIKIACEDRSAKKELIKALCQTCQCQPIQAIGNIVLVFRACKEPNPKLSNLLRA
jgi:RNA-binding protein